MRPFQSKIRDRRESRRKISENTADDKMAPLDELWSYEWDDMADHADDLHNKKLGDYIRDRGTRALGDELGKTYSKTVDRLAETTIDRKKFYVVKFIPSNIYALVYIQNVKKCVIVRITDSNIKTMTRGEILDDIALDFGKEAVAVDNARSISAVFTKNRRSSDNMQKTRQYSEELADFVNRTVGSHIPWRAFYGDYGVRDSVNGVTWLFNPYGNKERVGGYQIDIMQYNTGKPDYNIFYINIGDSTESHMIRIYNRLKLQSASGVSMVNPAWKAMVRNGRSEGLAKPTSTSSNIVNVYEFLNGTMTPQVKSQVFRVLTRMLNFRVGNDIIDDAYNAYMDDAKAAQARQDADAQDGAAQAPEDDFADF